MNDHGYTPPTDVTARPGLYGSWVRFWFTPADAVGLHVLRLLAGLLFVAWLLPFAGHLDGLFGLHGWFDQQAFREAARLPDGSPRTFGWSLLYPVGANPANLKAFYWASLAVLALFAVGVWVRLTAVLTWLVVVSFASMPAFGYDGDGLLVILALYLMVGYVFLGQRDAGLSLPARLLGPVLSWPLGGRAAPAPAGRRESLAAGLALRLLQVHLAIVLVTSGLHKLQFGDWWAGVALWYPAHPPLQTTVESARAHARDAIEYLTVLSLAAYSALAWQIGFPLFAWRPGWRLVLLGGAAVGWFASSQLYGLPLFGPAVFIGCLGFLTSEEWRRLVGWVARVPGLHALAGEAHVPAAAPGERGKARPERPSLVAGRHS